MLDDGGVRLAPLYDSLCTLIYPKLDGEMGAQIGSRTNLAEMDRVALLDEAKAMALTTAEAGSRVSNAWRTAGHSVARRNPARAAASTSTTPPHGVSPDPVGGQVTPARSVGARVRVSTTR
jgi:hypothetical protein